MRDAPLMTVAELAEHLHLTPKTIRLWARSGRIPGLNPTPRVWRFRLADVLKALEAKKPGDS